MEYQLLGEADKVQLLRQRLANLEVEHYQHVITATIAEDKALVVEAEKAQVILEDAIKRLQEMISELQTS